MSPLRRKLNSRTRAGLLVFAACLFTYTLMLVVVPHFPGMPSTDGDEPHYLIIAQSLLKDGDLDVENNYLEQQYRPYYQLDIELPHMVEGRGGRMVSTHPAFLSMVVLPGFALFGFRGAAMTMIFFTSLAAALTFAIADRFIRRLTALGVVLFLFFTYPILFYSRLIYPETMALFLLPLGVMSCLRLKENGSLYFAAVSGLSAGLLILFHPKFIALAIALLVLTLMVSRSTGSVRPALWWWLAPAFFCLAGLLVITGLTYGPNLLSGLTASGGSRLMGGYLGTNSVWGVVGMFLDRAWGLFIFAPIYMLFPHGLAMNRGRLEWSRWWAFFPLAIALHVLMMGIFQSWNGGACPVQRYLIPLSSLFVIGLALFADRCRLRAGQAVAAALALVQVITTVWAFRFIIGTFGLEGGDNIFLEHFLGNSLITRVLLAIFPMYHPAGLMEIVLTLAWLALFAATVRGARNYYASSSDRMLETHSQDAPGGNASPGVGLR